MFFRAVCSENCLWERRKSRPPFISYDAFQAGLLGWLARARMRALEPYVHRPYPRSCQVRFSVRRSKNLLLPAEFRRGKKLYTCWSKWWQPWKNSPPVNLGQAPSIRGIRVPRPPTTRPLWPWRRTRTPPIPPVSLKSIWILGTLKLCLASSKLFN